MKNTILSGSELKLLEDVISQHGVIVQFSQLAGLFKDKSRQEIRNLISKLSKNGWLVRIKKGLYFIAGLESLGFLGLSIYKTAQLIEENSYVSFGAALQYHGMFDQALKTILSVTPKRHPEKCIGSACYKFITCRNELFYGWREERVENYLVKIAYPEKALIDMLCFHRTIHTVDVVLEKLKEHSKDLDFKRFDKFIEAQPMAVKRIAGFLLDKVDIDSGKIFKSTKQSKNSSFMTSDCKKFNAKWRLYYSEHFDGVQ